MKKKITSAILKTLGAAIAVFLAVFIALEIFISVYNPVSTSMALNHLHEELITIEGMIFRSESYVTYDGDKVLDYSAKDGKKVSAGDTVALAYETKVDAETGRRIEELENRRETIKNNTSENDYNVIALDRIKDNIVNSLYSISSTVGENGVGDLYSFTEEFCGYVTKKQAATGANPDFSQKISEIDNEIAALKGSISKKAGEVKSPKSGYFFSSCDGYENSVDIANIAAMTVSDYENITMGEVPEGAIGKIADSFEWYYVFKAERSVAQNFAEESTVELRFPTSGAASFPATVRKVNYTGDEALVILSCTYMTDEYAVARDSAVQVIVDRIEGLYIDSDAVRFVNSVQGVYVLVGVEVKYRTIEILYSTEEFVIVKPEERGSGGIQLYDYVITKGNDLYDGKLIYAET